MQTAAKNVNVDNKINIPIIRIGATLLVVLALSSTPLMLLSGILASDDILDWLFVNDDVEVEVDSIVGITVCATFVEVG